MKRDRQDLSRIYLYLIFLSILILTKTSGTKKELIVYISKRNLVHNIKHLIKDEGNGEGFQD